VRAIVAGIAGLSLVLALLGAAPDARGLRESPGLQEAAGQRSVQDGVFSAAQAERGREVFDLRCFECHLLEDFQDPFMSSWEGATVYGLYQQLRTTMPYETPGTLEQQEYVDVLAYLFRINGVPAGEEELPAEQESLENIVIEGPFETEGGR